MTFLAPPFEISNIVKQALSLDIPTLRWPPPDTLI